MRLLNYRVKIKKIPEGYMLWVPALRGCITWAKTYEGVIEMGKDAISGMLEVLRKHNQPIPVQRRSLWEILFSHPEPIIKYQTHG